MGNTETRVCSDIVTPSFQASSSTSKRMRHDNGDSDSYSSSKEVVKNMEEILIEQELVSEKLDSFVDESHRVHKPSAEAKELSSLKAVVARNLTCASCGQLPRVRPLMLCASGHVTCASCYNLHRSLLQCAQSGCQLHVTEHPSSGLALGLLGAITRPCGWSHHGCGHQGPLTDIETHEPRCEFQEVQCLVCGSSPSLANFHHHKADLSCFQKNTIHNVDKQGKTSLTMTVSSGRQPPLAVLFHDSLFFIRVTRIKARSVWVASVAGQMVKEDCSRFLVSLDLKCPDDKSAPSFSFSGPPCSLTSSVEDILKDGHCLVLTDPAVTNITGGRVKERHLIVTLKINNVKS